MRKILKTAMACAAVAICAPASAAETIWFDSQHAPYHGGEYSTGTALQFSGGGVNATVTAWQIRNQEIYQAKLGVWPDGLGVNSSGDSSHTTDNSGYIDFLFFQFDKVVELQNATFWTGWHGMNDTDATVGYLTTSDPIPIGSSWNGQPQSLLGALSLYSSTSSSYGNSGDNTRDINPLNKTANNWLIGASFANPDGSYKKDGFKLEKLTFERPQAPPPPPPPPPAVPEPTTWAMMLLGFGFVGAAMRSAKRRQKVTVSYA